VVGNIISMSTGAAGSPRSAPRPSGRRPCGPALLCWLRPRWRIENAFTYAAAHHGIDTLADYLMDIGPDQRMVTNPARTAARAAVAAAEAALAAAERALPQLLAGPSTTKQKNAARPGAHRRIEAATRTLELLTDELNATPAHLPGERRPPVCARPAAGLRSKAPCPH
jgi:hypothetical protein